MLGWQAFCLEENNLYDLAEKTARKVIQCLIFIIEIFLKNILSEKYIQVFIRICRLREWRDVEISPKEKSSKNPKSYICVPYLHQPRIFKCYSDSSLCL